MMASRHRRTNKKETNTREEVIKIQQRVLVIKSFALARNLAQKFSYEVSFPPDGVFVKKHARWRSKRARSKAFSLLNSQNPGYNHPCNFPYSRPRNNKNFFFHLPALIAIIFLFIILFLPSLDKKNTFYIRLREAEHGQCLFSLPQTWLPRSLCALKSVVDAMN